MNGIAIGIDVGGTKIGGALVDRDGRVLHDVVVPVPRSSVGADPGAGATAGVMTALLGAADERGLGVIGAGVGIPEYVDPAGRRSSSLVLDWPDDLGDVLPHGIGVTVESDVRCAARAESTLGRGAGHGSCLYVSLGTGVSHSLVIAGHVWAGVRGEAIAFGELRVSADDVLVPSAPLTVEGQASGLALERVAARLEVDPLADDPRLDRARARAGRTVGAAIGDLVAVFDPAVVVLGGGLGVGGGVFGAALAQRYAERTNARPAAPPLTVSALGDRAGRIGAGLLVHGV